MAKILSPRTHDCQEQYTNNFSRSAQFDASKETKTREIHVKISLTDVRDLPSQHNEALFHYQT